MASPQATSLDRLLAERVAARPDQLAVRAWNAAGRPRELTYGGLWRLACRWAALLAAHGVAAGDPVLLALPNDLDFVGAFWGAQLRGAVPAAIPPKIGAIDRAPRIGARVVVIEPGSEAAAGLNRREAPAPPLLLTRDDLPEAAHDAPPTRSRDDLALLQLTSGTCGPSRAVKLPHRAVLAQLEGLATALELEPDRDSSVSWLPMHHDMGLVGFLLTPLFVGRHTTLLRTEDFATRPLAWLRALSETRATITGGPPSAFALCARRVHHREAAELDLGALRIALVGAEPIPSQVLEAFAERFATSGFDRRAWLPTYGLAENVLAVTMPPLRREPVFDAVDLTSLERDGVATPVVAGRDRSRSVAAVGPPLPGLNVEILGPDGRSLPERRVGEIVVAGPTLMAGYLDDPGASRDAIPDGRLRTGDLGYLAGGELHVVGRQKELIIVGGRNHHPEEIEAAAATVPGVRSGRAVAVGIRDEIAATDRVIVLVETAVQTADARDLLRQEVRLAVTRAGYPVDEVRLLPPRSIRTTTSGKLRRLEWRQRSLEHGLADTD